MPPDNLKPPVITAQKMGMGLYLENREIHLVHRLSSKEASLLQALLQCFVLISVIFSEFAKLAPYYEGVGGELLSYSRSAWRCRILPLEAEAVSVNKLLSCLKQWEEVGCCGQCSLWQRPWIERFRWASRSCTLL